MNNDEVLSYFHIGGLIDNQAKDLIKVLGTACQLMGLTIRVQGVDIVHYSWQLEENMFVATKLVNDAYLADFKEGIILRPWR